LPSPTTPHKRTHVVWAVPRSLATTEGIFSFPLGTKMFQFPRFPSPGLCVQPRDAVGSPTAGFPIRISSDLHLYTTSRGFSQCPTSFFGTWRLGIHRKLLVAFLRDAEKSKLFALIFVFYSIGKVLLPLGSSVVDHLPVCLIFFIRHTRRLSTSPLYTLRPGKSAGPLSLRIRLPIPFLWSCFFQISSSSLFITGKQLILAIEE
jgi:hypothetical protein